MIVDSSPVYNNNMNIYDEHLNYEYNSDKMDIDNSFNNFNHSTVFIIISCSDKIDLEENNIKIIPKQNNEFFIKYKEFNIVKLKNNNYYMNYLNEKYHTQNKNYDTFQNKNIYLFSMNLIFKKEVSFRIKFKYENICIYSKNYFTVYNNQLLFDYCESYEIDRKFIDYINPFSNYNYLRDIINENFELTNYQRFIIFKIYFLINKKENYLPYLLDKTLEEIHKEKIINFEFIMFYLNTIIDYAKNHNLKFKTYMKKLFLYSLKSENNISYENYNSDEYNNIIEIIKNFRSKDEEENMYYYLFILIFYHSKNQNIFEKYFIKIDDNYKFEALSFIIKYSNFFRGLSFSDLQLICKYSQNKIEFSDILNLASDSNEYLKFFCSYQDYLIREKPKINFYNIPSFDKNTDLSLLLIFVNILDNIYFTPYKEKIENNFLNLIKIYEGTNLKVLLTLKGIFNNSKMFYIKEHILNALNEAIHITGKDLIEKDELNSLEIIQFIHEDALNYYRYYQTNNEYVKLIGHIKLNEVDDNLCKAFNTINGHEYDYEVLFGSKYKLFINSIIGCAKTFKDLKFIFKLFNIKENTREKDEIINQLINAIGNNKLDRSELKIKKISKIIGVMFELVSKNDNKYLNDLIKSLKKTFSDNEIIEISILIIDNYGNRLNENVLKELTNNIGELTSDNIPNYLNKFKDNELVMNFILNKFEKKKISNKLFFKEEVSENLKILKGLVDNSFFENDENNICKKSPYLKNLKCYVSYIIKKLETFEFSMEQLKELQTLDNENSYNLKERLYIFTYGDKKKSERLYKSLKSKINECIDTFEIIEEIITNLENYYPNDKLEDINYFKKIRENIMKNNIYEFPEKIEIKNFDDLYNLVYNINRWKRSSIFIEIFERNKINEKKDSEIMEKTKEEFNSLKNLFDTHTENMVDLVLLEEVMNKINKENIENEVEILSDIFKINDKALQDEVCHKLKLLQNKNKTIKLLNNIILLLKDFEIPDINVEKTVENAIKKLNNKPTLKHIEKLYKVIDEMKINLLKPEFYKYQFIINGMYSEPNLIKFVIDKEINDIHQM
eukprot:jgi/Orpsp1_1/1179412/evm.model.c7180000069230.1